MWNKFLFTFCGFIICLVHTSNTQDSNVLLWTQRSHLWSKVRGLLGDPAPWVTAQHSYSVPLRQTPAEPNTYRYGLGYHPEEHSLVWSDRVSDRIFVQGVEASLGGSSSSSGSPREILSLPDTTLGAVTVDWRTDSVYFAAEIPGSHFIGVAAWAGKANTYKMLVSEQSMAPQGIAVDPYDGYVFWSNQQGSHSIERCLGDGSQRRTLRSGLSSPSGVTLDLATKRLYFLERGVGGGMLWSMDYGGNDARVLYKASGSDRGYFGVALTEDYIFITTGEQLSMDILHRDGSYVRTTDIDAQIYHVTATPSHSGPVIHDCEEMGCEHLCLNTGGNNGVCACAENFVLLSDGKSCAESRPLLVYARQTSVVAAQALFDAARPDSLTLQSRLLTSAVIEGRAVTGHYTRRLVYYSDVSTELVRRTDVIGSTWRDITANARQVEGLAVDWRSDVLFWSAFNLDYIMCSALSGHFHRRHVTGTSNALDLTIDPVLNRLLWVQSQQGSGASIEVVDLTGGNRRQLVTTSNGMYRDLVVDPVTRRLYFSIGGVIETVNLSGGEKTTLSMRSGAIYGLSLYEGVFTYTTEPDAGVMFWNSQTQQSISTIQNTWIGTQDTFTARHYDVTILSAYLQPPETNACSTGNGGCSQLCFPTASGRQCACAIGYLLSGATSCISALEERDFLLFVDPYHRQIYQAAVNTSSPVTAGVPLPRSEFPIAADYDLAGRRVIWLDAESGVIRSANLDGTGARTLNDVGNNLENSRLVVDSASRYIYYTRPLEKSIYRMEIDGSAHHEQFVTNNNTPAALAIDYTNGYLYWTTLTDGQLWRSDVKTKESVRLRVSGLSRPQALAFSLPELTLFIGDSYHRSIYSLDLNVTDPSEYTLQTEFSSADDVYAVAVNRDYIYYSTWRGKFVKAINKKTRWAEVIDREWFARVTDLKLVSDLLPYIAPAPVVDGGDDNWWVWAAVGAAAGFLFLLGLLLLWCCCCRRKPLDKTPPSESSSSSGFDQPVDSVFDLYASAGLAERGMSRCQGSSADSAPLNRQDSGLASQEDAVSTTDLLRQSSTNSVSSGELNGSPQGGVMAMPPPPPPAKSPFSQKQKKTGSKRFKTPVEGRISGGAGGSGPTGEDNPDFALQGDKKVSTVVSRLARRLRDRLSSIHYKNPKSRPAIPDPSGEQPEDEPDLSESPDFGSHRPQNRPEKAKVPIPGSLHPPPCGWAPASNFVPRTLIPNSWGRVKGVVMMKKNQTTK